MDWLQVLTIAGSTIGAGWWFARETREEVEQFKLEMKEFRTQCQQESKDFHGRLCALEERYLQMMHRVLEKKDL